MTEMELNTVGQGICVVTGGSIGIDERKMSSKRLIKVRSFAGAT